ncbi:MAG: PDZ domain-containing protein [Desulfobacterales bacterium]|nr:PDZ domain-containing protein [Desulfobacterales bacterium]
MIDKAFTALHLLLITVISALAVDLVYSTVTSRIPLPQKVQKRSVTAVVSRSYKKPAAGKSLSRYAIIGERNLFQLVEAEKASEVKVEETINVESLAETGLRLKLWGTISGDAKPFTWAIIEDETLREQDLYKVGDTVLGAELKLVLRDRVVVHYQGRDEVLLMEKDEEFDSARKRLSSSRFRRSRELPPSAITKRVSLSRDTINDAMMNISTLMKDVRIRPHFRNGVPEGMAVSGIKSNSIFRKMGIRNGDIILGVDGQKIESVDDAMGFYGNLRTASEIKLDIKRLGQIQTIEYTIE